MNEVEMASNKALEMLKTINSLEELNQKKGDILETILVGLENGLKGLKDMIETSTPTSEINTKYEDIQNSLKVMEQVVDEELDRIAELPETANYVKSLKGEILGYSSPIITNINFLRIDLMKR